MTSIPLSSPICCPFVNVSWSFVNNFLRWLLAKNKPNFLFTRYSLIVANWHLSVVLDAKFTLSQTAPKYMYWGQWNLPEGKFQPQYVSRKLRKYFNVEDELQILTGNWSFVYTSSKNFAYLPVTLKKHQFLFRPQRRIFLLFVLEKSMKNCSHITWHFA